MIAIAACELMIITLRLANNIGGKNQVHGRIPNKNPVRRGYPTAVKIDVICIDDITGSVIDVVVEVKPFASRIL